VYKPMYFSISFLTKTILFSLDETTTKFSTKWIQVETTIFQFPPKRWQILFFFSNLCLPMYSALHLFIFLFPLYKFWTDSMTHGRNMWTESSVVCILASLLSLEETLPVCLYAYFLITYSSIAFLLICMYTLSINHLKGYRVKPLSKSTN
jgi:hypothetical protein